MTNNSTNTDTEEHGGYWGEHPDWSVHDWQYEVANGDTRRGYWEWVEANATELQQRESLHAIGDKFAIQWQGKTHYFEHKRDAIAWIERNVDETFQAWAKTNEEK